MVSKSRQDVMKFINFAARELGLSSLPSIKFVGKSENIKNAFGHFMGSGNNNSITVRIVGRHPVDIMRTIAHELVHYKQRITGTGVNKPESMREDEANAIAGRIMRKFDIAYPRIFNDAPILSEEGSVVPANAMGSSSSVAGSGGIDTIDPMLGTIKDPLLNNQKKKLKQILRRK